MVSVKPSSAPPSPVRPNRLTVEVRGSNNNITQNDEVVMEGNMLKRTSRLSKKYWRSRYFVFNGADNTLHYYKQQGDEKARGSYLVSDLTGTEVSDLFVQKHRKQLIYCLRVKFNNLNNDDDERGGGMSDYDDDDDDDEDQSLSSYEYSLGDLRGAAELVPFKGGLLPPPKSDDDDDDDDQENVQQQSTAQATLLKPAPQKIHQRAKSSESMLKISPRRIAKRAVSTTGGSSS